MYISFDTIKNETCDEAIYTIKQCKAPKTWGEYDAERKRWEANPTQPKVPEASMAPYIYYQNEAKRGNHEVPHRGLYFYISKDNEVWYVGKSDTCITDRLQAHMNEDEVFKECHTSIVFFPKQWQDSELGMSEILEDKHLRFYEQVFLALLNPRLNKLHTGHIPSNTFRFIREKQLTIVEALRIRVHCK